MFEFPMWTASGAMSLAASWLLTFALHSTIALSLAWVVTRRVESLNLRDASWKAALFIPLLTTSAQVGLDIRPVTGALSLAPPVYQAAPPQPGLGVLSEPKDLGVAEAATIAMVPVNESVNDLDASVGAQREATAGAAMAATTNPPATNGVISRLAHAARRITWMAGLLLLWATGALIGLTRLWVARLRLSRVLRLRRDVEDPELLRQLEGLRSRARLHRPVRLTWSRQVAAPVAFRREICLPREALSRLSGPQLSAVLAHETAHVARRDSWWLFITLLLERVFFFQPLYGTARRDLQSVAEYLCDDWAVVQTGRKHTIAESLAEVATWLSGSRRPLTLPSMARDRSQLVRRVERILDGKTMFRTDTRRDQLARATLAGAVTALMVVGAPGVLPGAIAQVNDAPINEPALDVPTESVRALEAGNETVRGPQPVTPAPEVDRTRDDVVMEPPPAPSDSGPLDAELEMTSTPAPFAVVGNAESWEAEVAAAAQDTLNPRVVASLVRALSDSTAAVRKEAAEALGRLKATAAVPGLIRGLNDEDASVRLTVVRALARIGDGQAADGLVDALTDPSASVRSSAAEAIGELGVRRAAPAVASLLNDEHPDIRRQAIAQLWRLRDTSSVDAIGRLVIDTVAAVRRTAVSALGQFRQSSSYGVLVGALSDDEPAVRAQAISSLARLRDPRAYQAFASVLSDDSPDVRNAAVRALGAVKDSTAIPGLIRALNDDAEKVRLSAVNALREFDDVRTLAPFTRLLSDPSADVRIAAVRGLGELDDDDVLTPLTTAAQRDSVASVRRAALGGLARFYRPAVIAPMIAALSDPEPAVRVTAARAFRQFGEFHHSSRAQQHDSYSEMEAAFPRAAPALIATIDHDDSDVREAVVRALGYLRDAVAVDALIVALQDGASDVRKEAVNALGRIHDERAIDPIIALLQDPDSEVRRAAVRTLGRFPDRR
jgi:HEAT repeat protein/beta-lactamase regulating signal transducer with metallopeptidase domain